MTTTDRRAAPTSLEWTDLDRRAVDTVRVLAMDAVQKAGNGHPGTAMSLAPAAYLLFQRLMRHDPADPNWPGRDRFVLSCGHSSLTQYIQLYLSGYGLELDDLKALRTWGSADARATPSTATPPASRPPPARSARAWPTRSAWRWPPAASAACSTRTPPPGESPFDHTIWVLASDGDIEEGVTTRPVSLAGHQQLGNLVVIYDAQPHLDRGRHRRRAERGRRRAVRGVRLARPARRLDQGGTGGYDTRTSRRCTPRCWRPRAETGAAVVHRAAHDHRLAGAEQAEHRQGARLGARRGRGRRHQEDPRLRPGRDLRVADEVLAHAREVVDRGARRARARGTRRFDAWRAANPERRRAARRG